MYRVVRMNYRFVILLKRLTFGSYLSFDNCRLAKIVGKGLILFAWVFRNINNVPAKNEFLIDLYVPDCSSYDNERS